MSSEPACDQTVVWGIIDKRLKETYVRNNFEIAQQAMALRLW
jgi:hypothetical protein